MDTWRRARATILAPVAILLLACAGAVEHAPTHVPEQPGEEEGRDAEDRRAEVLDEEPSAPDPHPPEKRTTPTSPRRLGPEVWKPGRLPSHPEGAIDITPRGPNRCIAQLELGAELVGNEIQLRATLASNSDSSVSVTLNAPCPGGPVEFSGLGDGFDYYGTCNAGACQKANEPLSVFPPAGRRKVEIAATSFSVSGDSCRPRLSGGTREIYGQAEVLSPEGATICGSAHTKLALPETEKKRAVPAPVSCPKGPVCGLACPSGSFARDENGCLLCACTESFPSL